MAFETWLWFAIIYAAFSAIPGPSVLAVVGQTLAHGVANGLRCVVGDLAGGVIMVSLGFAGLGAILAASDAGFQAVKWVGTLYLVWLGLHQLWHAGRNKKETPRGFVSGFVIGIVNPKANAFFIAFTAQFIDPALPGLPQFLILGATSMGMAGIVLCCYVAGAGYLRRLLFTAKARKRTDQLGGTVLVGSGVALGLRG
ncbi:LysE family translocator [Rhodobacteraceae bacterium D3-12]|nr:LysE family translocator [Rhodobacteraceae bacterium D3-12]